MQKCVDLNAKKSQTAKTLLPAEHHGLYHTIQLRKNWLVSQDEQYNNSAVKFLFNLGFPNIANLLAQLHTGHRKAWE